MDNNKSAVEEFLGDLGGNKETNPFEENQENPFITFLKFVIIMR